MAATKIALLLVAFCIVTQAQGRNLQTAAEGSVDCQVTFFDDDFEGGSQTFDATVPYTSKGCSECTNLNLIRTNSWESYISSCGDTITLYDDRNCKGTSAAVPARSGVIKGSLSNSVDSFVLCFGVTY